MRSAARWRATRQVSSSTAVETTRGPYLSTDLLSRWMRWRGVDCPAQRRGSKPRFGSTHGPGPSGTKEDAAHKWRCGCPLTPQLGSAYRHSLVGVRPCATSHADSRDSHEAKVCPEARPAATRTVKDRNPDAARP